MITQEQINRGGSKLEITRALIEAGLDREIPIPRSTWKYSGQSLDSVLQEFQRMRKPVIVRGSHPNDYHGFIDVIPTHRNVETISQLESAIGNIETTMQGEDIKIHCEDWNQPYTPEVHALIQEQGSNIVGSMLRHPHAINKTIIQYFDVNYVWNQFTCRPTGMAEEYESGTTNRFLVHVNNFGVTDSDIEKLIEMYEKLEQSGILNNKWSQHVEFGLNPLRFYQAKPFKKFQPKLDFNLPLISEDCFYITPIECFGITPAEGIDIDFFPADEEMFGDYKNRKRIFYEYCEPELDGWIPGFIPPAGEYGLIMIKEFSRSPSPRQRFGNLRVFCSAASCGNFLYHPDYRLMKRADISLVRYYVRNSSDNVPREVYLEHFKQSCIFSNGQQAMIIPRKYL